jgi:hypothetical protein
MLCYMQVPAGMELTQQMQQLPSDDLQQQLQLMPAGMELPQHQMHQLPSELDPEMLMAALLEPHELESPQQSPRQLQRHHSWSLQQPEQQEQQGLSSGDPELCGGQAYSGEPIPHSPSEESAMSPVMPQMAQVIFQPLNYGCGTAAFPGDGGFHAITGCGEPVSFPTPTLQPLLQMDSGLGNPMQPMMMGLCDGVPEASTEPVGEEGKESWAQDDAMPTQNGFIHFPEASDDSDNEIFPVGRRPRANSH